LTTKIVKALHAITPKNVTSGTKILIRSRFSPLPRFGLLSCSIDFFLVDCVLIFKRRRFMLPGELKEIKRHSGWGAVDDRSFSEAWMR